MAYKKDLTSDWFTYLRDQLCTQFEELEKTYSDNKGLTPGKFIRKKWPLNTGTGGGEMSLMHGNLFEKVGVNISKVAGKFDQEFSKQIPGTENDPSFFATGISLVAHMKSPLVPPAHFNTRYIVTSKDWFGGGGDLNPIYPDEQETKNFHQAFKDACDKHDENYYLEFKEKCDEYFFIKHRNEHRGVGGIFYDYLNTGNFDLDFAFTQDVGRAFLEIYPKIIAAKMFLDWTKEQREYQSIKRGRYAEFNLIYDRGTKFGLMTGGNPEAILMSLPPIAKWL
jgi:coproporphyrinogen III oxidase